MSCQSRIGLLDPIHLSDPDAITEADYKEIESRIIKRVEGLKSVHPSLADRTSPYAHEYNVNWVTDAGDKDMNKKGSGRRLVFSKEGGYRYKLTFYRGAWRGAAMFKPITFGRLNLWYDHDYKEDASVIIDIGIILEEERNRFYRMYR